MRSLLLAAAAVLALAQTARASVIPVLGDITPSGANFTFHYDGQLATDQGVTSGDELVIIDFRGYVPGSIHSSLANVSASISNTLPLPISVDGGFHDDSAIPDLVFTYTGADFQTTGGPFPSIIHFDGLSADSIFGGTAAGYFAASAVQNVGGLAGSTTYNVGRVEVPIDASPVPEPASWSLMIVGFLGLGTVLRIGRSRGRGMAARNPI
jgi:hypothetical protein